MIEPGKRPAETPVEWLRFAEENLLVAERALSFEEPAWHTICFLCQSAAEKFLKAYLIAQGWKLERTHDIVVLMGLCAARHWLTFRLRLGLSMAALHKLDALRETYGDEADLNRRVGRCSRFLRVGRFVRVASDPGRKDAASGVRRVKDARAATYFSHEFHELWEKIHEIRGPLP